MESTAILYEPVFAPEVSLDGQPVTVVAKFSKLKDVLQHGENPRWFDGDIALTAWIDEVKTTLSEPEYHFTDIYVTIIDPRGIAKLPEGVIELFNKYDYRVWRITDLN